MNLELDNFYKSAKDHLVLLQTLTNANNISPELLLLGILVVVILFIFLQKINKRTSTKTIENIPDFPTRKRFYDLFRRLTISGLLKKINDNQLVYANVSKATINSKLIIIIKNPKDVELVLNTHTDHNAYWKIGFINCLEGEEWLKFRKILEPAFRLNTLKDLIPIFNKNSQSLVKKLEGEEGKMFDCDKYVEEILWEIFLETTLGLSHYNKNQENTNSGIGINYTNVKDRNLNREDLSDIILATKEKEKIIKNLNSKIKNNRVSRSIVLDLLLDAVNNGVVLTKKEICDLMNSIFSSGIQPTCEIICRFLLTLSEYPEVQERLQHEIDEIFGGSNRFVTFADVLEMKYLDRCLLETMRLHPSIRCMNRSIKHDFKLSSNNYTIPAGATVIIPIEKIHRNGNSFLTPDQFNPDHFLPEQVSSRHLYSFLPFGCGPRNCIGKKYAILLMKIIITTILRTYEMRSLHKGVSDNFSVKFEPRSKTFGIV